MMKNKAFAIGEFERSILWKKLVMSEADADIRISNYVLNKDYIKVAKYKKMSEYSKEIKKLYKKTNDDKYLYLVFTTNDNENTYD